jgi:hypothetical protein
VRDVRRDGDDNAVSAGSAAAHNGDSVNDRAFIRPIVQRLRHVVTDVAPLVIEFVAPSSLLRESHRVSDLPIVRNGPPGTFVVLPGLKVSLPTDQIVAADDSSGHARVGFGGMRFDGVQDGRLLFRRVRELAPEQQLSPDRSYIMRLESEWVHTVFVDGVVAWPLTGRS